MAKINILFNGTNYSINEAALESAVASLKSHFSSVINGTGTTIKLGGVTYNIDSTKLTEATNDFVTHLGTIAGSGSKVVVNGVKYGMDSTKLNNAVAEIHATLNNLSSGGDEPSVASEPYLTFSSPSSFTLNVVDNTKYWDGTLEYSTDTSTWSEWDGTTTLSADDGKLYMRGTGNTYITGSNASSSKAKWVLTGNDISCMGNIENLLDYTVVANGEHPTMTESCYRSMLRDCTSLTTAPELPATTLVDFCYSNMFYNCTSLTTAPELPATILAEGCYTQMFRQCNFTTAPELPVTILAEDCYSGMFYGCAKLTTAPELPATILAEGCYKQMFYYCDELTQAPKLSATTVAESCYREMFYGCTKLTTAPELPATTLANNCYNSMFEDCKSLIAAPELPATTLAEYCYSHMFHNCTSLTTVPELSATTMKKDCYAYMFANDENIKLSETQADEYQIEYRMPTSGTGTTASNAFKNMFNSTGGTFTGTPSINTTYYLHTSNSVV